LRNSSAIDPFGAVAAVVAATVGEADLTDTVAFTATGPEAAPDALVAVTVTVAGLVLAIKSATLLPPAPAAAGLGTLVGAGDEDGGDGSLSQLLYTGPDIDARLVAELPLDKKSETRLPLAPVLLVAVDVVDTTSTAGAGAVDTAGEEVDTLRLAVVAGLDLLMNAATLLLLGEGSCCSGVGGASTY